jgi:hypothetical protein
MEVLSIPRWIAVVSIIEAGTEKQDNACCVVRCVDPATPALDLLTSLLLGILAGEILPFFENEVFTVKMHCWDNNATI